MGVFFLFLWDAPLLLSPFPRRRNLIFKNASKHRSRGTTRLGFVFTNLDLGTKYFNVDVVGDDKELFKDRAQKKQDAGISVTATVLTSRDCVARFGANLYQRNIQPVWLEIENGTDEPMWFMPLVKTFGYVKGVGAAPYSDPRGNLTGDPYFTDGNRAVLWISSQSKAFSEVEWIDWEKPTKQ